MLKKKCPKCGSHEVKVKAEVLDPKKGKVKTKEMIYNFLSGPKDFKNSGVTIDIKKIVKCASCGEKYDEKKWKVSTEE